MEFRSGQAGSALRQVPIEAWAFSVATAVGVLTAAWFSPEPFSDWEYYWLAASDLSLYERGGVLMLLLGMIQLPGLSPTWAALLFNLPFVAVLLWTVGRIDRAPWRPFALAVSSGTLLLAPYLTVVQLDFSASVLLGVGLALLLDTRGRFLASTRWQRVLAFALVLVACSTRPQFVLVLPVFAALFWLVVLASSRRAPARDVTWTAIILILGSAVGFAIDSGLREVADRSSSVRTSSGVTLYAGLLATHPGKGCGRWSPEATAMARADMGRSVLEAVSGRLSDRPAGDWLGVMGCKVPDIVFPAGFAMNWVLASPNVAYALAGEPESRSTWMAWQASRAFDRAWRAFTVVGYLMALWVAVRGSAAGPWRWMPLAWLVSFWSVHLVFEIQERYFLGTLLLLPLLACLAWRSDKRGSDT